MRLYRILLNSHKHQILYQDETGHPKTHHRNDCEHCRDGGHKSGCFLPFKRQRIKFKERPQFNTWKFGLIWRNNVKT